MTNEANANVYVDPREIEARLIKMARQDRVVKEFKGQLLKTAIIIAVVSVAVGMALMYLWLSWNGAIVPVQ